LCRIRFRRCANVVSQYSFTNRTRETRNHGYTYVRDIRDAPPWPSKRIVSSVDGGFQTSSDNPLSLVNVAGRPPVYIRLRGQRSNTPPSWAYRRGHAPGAVTERLPIVHKTDPRKVPGPITAESAPAERPFDASSARPSKPSEVSGLPQGCLWSAGRAVTGRVDWS